jgi:glutamate/tyrosine decarboxylase-like PLP-dependent enzyme
MSVIAVHGMITIVCYRHPEGELELQALRELAVELDQQMWVVTETTFSNQRGKPPLVLTIVRQS